MKIKWIQKIYRKNSYRFRLTGAPSIKAIKLIQIYPGQSIAEVKKIVKSGKFRATTDMKLIKQMDTISICVPTPLSKTKDPDVSFILNALSAIKPHMKKGM